MFCLFRPRNEKAFAGHTFGGFVVGHTRIFVVKRRYGQKLRVSHSQRFAFNWREFLVCIVSFFAWLFGVIERQILIDLINCILIGVLVLNDWFKL
jgi:uncharacterized membrane-anchored protein